MKIGLTGATGFIGQYLIKMYGDKYEFVAITSKENTDYLCQLATYRKANYSIDSFENVFVGCDAVIHLGGKVMHGLDCSMEVSGYVENLELCENVFRACNNLGIKNVVFTSSVAVYDQRNANPVDEEDKCQPNSMYGVMKLAAEKIAEIYNRRYDMCIKTLRVAQVLGLHEKIDTTQFWDKLLVNSYNKKPITVYGKGITGRDIIYVKDVAIALMAAVNKCKLSGVYNIGTGYICTNSDIAHIYCDVFGNTSGIRFETDKEETGIQTCMNCGKAERDLGYKAQYDIKAMVSDIKNEYEIRINYKTANDVR